MREEIASADNRDDMEQAELPASLASLPAGSVRMLQPGPMGLSELLAQVMSHNGIACRSEQRSCMGAFNLFFGGTNRWCRAGKSLSVVPHGRPFMCVCTASQCRPFR